MSGDVLAGVGVVVVTYESAAFVRATLDALPRDRLHGVVVVDNASADGSADVARSVDGVRVVAMDTNVGFGAGCNAGARELPDATKLLFLNPDAVITADALTTLAAYLDVHPSCGMVAPRLFTANGQPLTSAGHIATLRTELHEQLPVRLRRLVGGPRQFPPAYAQSGPVPVVEGACMLVDAGAWRAAGGFDERYFLFFEEHDLARRLRRAGRATHLCAQARVRHGVGLAREQTSWAAATHYVASAYRYLARWQGRWAAETYQMVCGLSWRALVLAGLLPRERCAAQLAAIRAAAVGHDADS